MIEGDVKINGNEIGRWEAYKTGTTTHQGTEYHVIFQYRDGAGYPRSGELTVYHQRGNGALILAAVVLTGIHDYLYAHPINFD